VNNFSISETGDKLGTQDTATVKLSNPTVPNCGTFAKTIQDAAGGTFIGTVILVVKTSDGKTSAPFTRKITFTTNAKC
jgi:hypothetical protein